MQTVAVPRILDLHRVGGGDGVDAGGAEDRALHHVQLAVHLQDLGLCGRNTDALGVDLPAVLALILDVVDGKEGLDVVVPRILAVEEIVVDGYQRCLPVVGVDEIGMEVDVGEHLEDGAGEERKSLGVIIEAVQLISLEVILVVDEVVGTIVPACPEQTAVLMSPCDRNGEVGDEVHLAFELIGNGAVQRHNDTAVMTLAAHGMGQRTCYVGKTAAARKRIRFARAIKDFHIVTS